MKRALIIGESGAIGGAVATRLRADGVEVIGLSRSRDGLDVTNGASVARVLGAVEGPFDFLLVASGGLEIGGVGPEKSIAQIEAEAMAAQFALNAIGPALVLRDAGRLLPRAGRSVCAVLTARVGSIGDNRLGGWHSYRAAKAAAHQIVRGVSIELGRTHKEAVVVALHPGTVRSALTERYLARHPAVAPDVAARHVLSVVGGLSAADSGGFYDWKGERVEW
jgi:NAD(P)-dependent dehydrogenase (short-subunit alcohol dehydrogenase family)